MTAAHETFLLHQTILRSLVRKLTSEKYHLQINDMSASPKKEIFGGYFLLIFAATFSKTEIHNLLRSLSKNRK